MVLKVLQALAKEDDAREVLDYEYRENIRQYRLLALAMISMLSNETEVILESQDKAYTVAEIKKTIIPNELHIPTLVSIADMVLKSIEEEQYDIREVAIKLMEEVLRSESGREVLRDQESVGRDTQTGEGTERGTSEG